MKQPKMGLRISYDPFDDENYVEIIGEIATDVEVSTARSEQAAWRMAEKRLRALANYAGKQADKLKNK